MLVIHFTFVMCNPSPPHTVQEAYDHTERCRPQVRPLRSFVDHLSQWEVTLMGQTHTDISEPGY